jgi:hypothetical protein
MQFRAIHGWPGYHPLRSKRISTTTTGAQPAFSPLTRQPRIRPTLPKPPRSTQRIHVFITPWPFIPTSPPPKNAHGWIDSGFRHPTTLWRATSPPTNTSAGASQRGRCRISPWRLDSPNSIHTCGNRGGGFLIDQLVGMAIEQTVLNNVDSLSAPEYLGMTVQERLDQLADQKAEIKALAPLAENILPSASEAELVTYLDRVRVNGELEALRWLKNRQP